MLDYYIQGNINLSLLVGACVGLATGFVLRRPRKWKTFAYLSILSVFTLMFVGGPKSVMFHLNGPASTFLYIKFFLTALFAGMSLTFLARYFLRGHLQKGFHISRSE